MTEDDFVQIDALLANTTAGRWLAVETDDGLPATHVMSEAHEHVALCGAAGDAAFIAQAPLMVERLVCALRASFAREDMLTQERDEARADLARSVAAWEAAGMQGRTAHDAMLALARERENMWAQLQRWREAARETDEVLLRKLDAAIAERDEARGDFAFAMRKMDEQIAIIADTAKERDEARSERDSAKLTAMAASMAHDSIEKMIRFELRVGPEDSLHEAVQRVRYERDEARAEAEKLSDAAKAAWDAECIMREQRDRFHAKWKQERQEVERLRAEAAPMNEHFNAGYRDGYRDAYRRGAEAMREACARLFDGSPNVPGLAAMPAYSATLRALPIPEEP